MASDTVMSDQQEGHGGLAQLFISADSAIERRRTDNIFKQLDERSLTEDEQRIIQQRIDLQRRLLQEYEKREQKRKVAELQDLWPELSEAAAIRALELCNNKEDEAVLRLTEDAGFKRRVLAETGTYTPVTVLPAKAAGTKSSSSSRLRSDKNAGSNSGSRVPSPSKLEGNVFVGRFRSKLGPCQERAVADAAAAAARAAAAATADPDQPKPKRRGRPKKRCDPETDTAAAVAAKRQTRAAAGAIAADGDAAAAAAEPADAIVAVETAGSTDRQRSSSPECEEGSATAAEDEDLPVPATADVAAEPVHGITSDGTPLASATAAVVAGGATPDATDETATNTDVGTDTDGPRSSRRSQRQLRVAGDGQAAAAAAERVISMMARQIARLEPLLAAGRLLEFEVRRPGSSHAVLDLLAVEYGEQVSDPIATAWEVLLEEQKWKEAEELAAYEASKHSSKATAAAAAPVVRQPVAAATEAVLPAAAAAAAPAHLADSSAALQQIPAQRFGGAVAEQPALQQQEQQHIQQQSVQQDEQDALSASGLAAALVAAAALSTTPTPAVSGQQQQQQHVSSSSGLGVSAAKIAKVSEAGDVSDASTVTEPIGSPLKPLAVAAIATARVAVPATEPVSSGDSGAAAAASIGGGTSGQQKRGRGRPPKRQAAAAASAAVAAVAAAQAAESSRTASAASAAGVSRGGGLGAVPGRAISETGHTCRGRVRQKSHKTTELVELGQLVPDSRWYNAGYIFPAGFKSRLLFRSSVDLDALTLHECEIVGEGGKHWPAPTFVVTARDREDEPVVAKSCTGCWSGILKRINAEIQRRIEQGEALPPPPRTAIAGPEYFGLNDTATIAAVETLDPNHLCTTYWVGKEQREAAAAGMPVAVQPRASKSSRGGGSGGGRKRGRRGEAGDADDEGEETGYRGAHWSSISRRERYIKRCTEAGDEAHVVEEQQLLPGVLDPITLEPVVNPAISPAGHVMGLATWKAVLTEQQRCPFTKAPLRTDQLIVLTVNNIEKYRDRIIAMR